METFAAERAQELYVEYVENKVILKTNEDVKNVANGRLYCRIYYASADSPCFADGTVG
jgi:hypothetical protein